MLPLAVSQCPQWQHKEFCSQDGEGSCLEGQGEQEPGEREQDDREQEEQGAGNVAFEDDGINLDSLISTNHIIKPVMKRLNTMVYQVTQGGRSQQRYRSDIGI